MKLSIVGTGYVGLVTGACLAEKGHDVTCVDIDHVRVDMLNASKSPILEEGLEDLLRNNVGRRLRATTDLEAAVRESEFTLIAVGTPFNGTSIDLSAVLEAARRIGDALRHKTEYHVVVVKSTVVPGTTDRQVLPALESSSGKKPGIDFGVGMNPEFLSQGEAVSDFMFPDRIVIGAIDERTAHRIEEVYSVFPGVPCIRTTNGTAELIKYASNALLANLISFSNEIANLGAALGGIDTVDVMRAVHLSRYFRGSNADGLPLITSFLKAGCGFGGSCLPKDVAALIAHGESSGQTLPLLSAIMQVNREQPGKIVQLLEKHWPSLEGVKVAVLGLSYKPGTNDTRETPAAPIIDLLWRRGAQLRAHDPVAIDEARNAFGKPNVTYCETVENALADVDAVVVVTPWPDYRQVPAILRDRNPQPVFVDARRAFDKSALARYEGVGL